MDLLHAILHISTMWYGPWHWWEMAPLSHSQIWTLKTTWYFFKIKLKSLVLAYSKYTLLWADLLHLMLSKCYGCWPHLILSFRLSKSLNILVDLQGYWQQYRMSSNRHHKLSIHISFQLINCCESTVDNFITTLQQILKKIYFTIVIAWQLSYSHHWCR